MRRGDDRLGKMRRALAAAPRLCWIPLLGFLGACANGQAVSNGSTDLVQAQVERGEELYRRHCYSCHEVEGVSVMLPPRVLASYFSARNLYDYIEMSMPYYEPGSLSPEENWAITAFLIQDRGLAPVEAPLAAAVGDSTRLSIADGAPE